MVGKQGYSAAPYGQELLGIMDYPSLSQTPSESASQGKIASCALAAITQSD